MPKLRITAQATCCALHYLLRRYKGVLGTKAVLNPVVKSIAVFFSLALLLWVASFLVYNVFLHPLRRFPGPRLWAASRLPWSWYQYQGTLQHRLLELHSEYGHTVRIAPNELSFTSDTACKTVYGDRAVEMGKDPMVSLHTATDAQDILGANEETHARQRRLLSHAFSEKALKEQEPILQFHVNKLMEQLSSRCSSGPVDLVAWYNFTTFDLLGDLSLGENFGCLDKGDYVPLVSAIKATAADLTLAQMWKHFGLTGVRRYFLPKSPTQPPVQTPQRATATALGRRLQQKPTRADLLSSIPAAHDSHGLLPASLHAPATSLPTLGAPPTATALAALTAHLLAHPPIHARLAAHLRRTFPSAHAITLASTAPTRLPYLHATLSESLRLAAPLPHTLPRVVPPGGATIDGASVPAATAVGVTPVACARHPGSFYRPADFLPERWMPGTRDRPPFARDRRAGAQPFSGGPGGCLGRELARAVLALVVARLLFAFDVEAVGGAGGLTCRLVPVVRG